MLYGEAKRYSERDKVLKPPNHAPDFRAYTVYPLFIKPQWAAEGDLSQWPTPIKNN